MCQDERILYESTCSVLNFEKKKMLKLNHFIQSASETCRVNGGDGWTEDAQYVIGHGGESSVRIYLKGSPTGLIQRTMCRLFLTRSIR